MTRVGLAGATVGERVPPPLTPQAGRKSETASKAMVRFMARFDDDTGRTGHNFGEGF
jgi:hypothetical protein